MTNWKNLQCTSCCRCSNIYIHVLYKWSLNLVSVVRDIELVFWYDYSIWCQLLKIQKLNTVNVSVLNCTCVSILWYYNTCINICSKAINHIACPHISHFSKLSSSQYSNKIHMKAVFVSPFKFNLWVYYWLDQKFNVIW